MADDPPGPLRSVMLKGNKRLQDCAQFDKDHVMPQSAPGPHIELINKALREIERLYPGQGYVSVPPGAGNRYEDETIKAVVALKSKHFLFTRGTRSIDQITGIGTINKIDELLRAKDTPKDTPTPKVPAKDPVLALSGRCQLIGQRMDDRNAGDLQFGDGPLAVKTAKTAALTAPLLALDDELLLGVMTAGINTMCVAGSSQEPASAAVLFEPQKMIARFASGAGSGDWVWAQGSPVSQYAIKAPGLSNFIDSNVRNAVRNAVREAWRAGVIDDAVIATKIRPDISSASPFAGGALAGFIGGIQGFTVKMCGLSVNLPAKSFSYRLEAQYFDHFGVDYTDVDRSDGSLGTGLALANWFVLQHYKSLPFRVHYRPFRTVLQVAYGPFTETA